MGSTILFQDRIVEVFDSERNPRDPDFFQRLNFFKTQCSRFTFKRYFVGMIPGDRATEFIPQELQLSRTEVRRGSPAEIDELQITSLDTSLMTEQFDFFGECFDITSDRVRVLVGIDAKVTELAAFPAEGNVQVQAHRHGSVWFRRECRADFRNLIAIP